MFLGIDLICAGVGWIEDNQRDERSQTGEVMAVFVTPQGVS
jgi:hypothetical protein